MLTVPATLENAIKIRRLSVKHGLASDSLNQIFNNIPAVTKISGFNFELKDFQGEGVAAMEKSGGRILLADEQGTGKTVQVMAYAHKNKMFPMMVVVPNSLKYNWRNEIVAMTGNVYKINIVGKDFSKKQTAIRAAKTPNVIYSKVPTTGCDIYVINYDILAANMEAIEAMNIRFMACDESHKCKNPDAKRTQAMQRLALGYYEIKVPYGNGKRERITVGKGIAAVTLMSGTPLVNRPKELWTTVSTIAPWVPQWNTFTRFAFRFCDPKRDTYGYNFNGSSNSAELNNLLMQHMMVRRLKKDVLKTLPPKTYRTIPLDFDRREYDKVENAFAGMDWKGGLETIVKMGGNAPKSDDRIVAIQKLREIAGYAKLASTVEWIKDYCEEGEKLVVFAHNRLVIDTIKIELEKDEDYRGAVGTIYGGISNDQRADAVHAFQNDANIRVIIVGIQAGGFGLTLTAAKAVAFVQLPWTPGEISQCVDRIHRIGQDADNVTVYNLVAEGTIEENVAEMIFAKGQILDSVLDAGRTVNAIDVRLGK